MHNLLPSEVTVTVCWIWFLNLGFHVETARHKLAQHLTIVYQLIQSEIVITHIQ